MLIRTDLPGKNLEKRNADFCVNAVDVRKAMAHNRVFVGVAKIGPSPDIVCALALRCECLLDAVCGFSD